LLWLLQLSAATASAVSAAAAASGDCYYSYRDILLSNFVLETSNLKCTEA
jgi:hypothetical protein